MLEFGAWMPLQQQRWATAALCRLPSPCHCTNPAPCCPALPLYCLCTACSQQYPLVEARLREVGGRVAPINDGVKALKELHEYIRADQVGRGWRYV